MMRNDPQDVEDIRFLLRQEKIAAAQLTQAFGDARVPPVPEIVQVFQAMQAIVLSLASGHPV